MRFLPEPKPGESYPLDQGGRFAKSTVPEGGFLETVAEKMVVIPPKSQPRRPTPFSQVSQFAEDLYETEGALGMPSEGKKRARRRFRALLALIALREHDNLALRLVASPDFGEDQVHVPIVEMFRLHFPSAPGGLVSEAAPRFFFLKLSGKVVAGLCGDCLLFPAARKLQIQADAVLPRWFSLKHNDWLDPTNQNPQIEGSQEKLNPREVARWRQALLPWLEKFCEWIESDARPVWLCKRDDLLREVRVWIEEIWNDGANERTEIIVKSISVDDRVGSFGFLELFPFAYASRGDGFDGSSTLFLTKSDITDPGRELFRNVFGSPKFGEGWRSAPVKGEHLGVALGLNEDLRDQLNVAFVFIDKLFTETICDVAATGNQPLNLGGKLLTVEGETAGNSRFYLFPIRSEAFEWFRPMELAESIRARKVAGTSTIEVSLTHSSLRAPATKTYDQETRKPLDDDLDFRLFPDYDISKLPNLERQLPLAEDRQYFTRIRLGEPLAEITITPVFEAQGGCRLARIGEEFSYSTHGSLLADGGKNGLGLRSRHVIKVDGDRRLVGFEFDGRGFIAFDLPAPFADTDPVGRRIGVDFGTSNTCLAISVGGGDEILHPTGCAEALLRNFVPAPRKGSHEGYSSLFDFFFVDWVPLGSANGTLFSRSYFPTQLASRRGFEFDLAWSGSVTPEEALICFRSPADFFREGKEGIVNSLRGYEGGGEAWQPAITLKDRLKWDDSRIPKNDELLKNLRRVFHRDLRLRIIHHVAKTGGYVSELLASYPRAFSRQKLLTYKDDLNGAWDSKNSSVRTSFNTESLSAAEFLGVSLGQDRYLIDIGGGTSDFALFSDGRLRHEASVRLASDTIDRFVLSPFGEVLRKMIVEGILSLAKFKYGPNRELVNWLKDRFEPGSVDVGPGVGFEQATKERAIYYAVMTCLREEAGRDGEELFYSITSEKIANFPAVGKFYRSLLLFYSGIVHFAGRMHEQYLAQGGPRQNRVTVSFAGNGSGHLKWLGGAGCSDVKRLFVEIFRSAAKLPEDAPIEFEDVAEPKSIVARGLLRIPEGTNPEHVPEGANVYKGLHADRWLPAGHGLQDLNAFYARSSSLTEGWTIEKSELIEFGAVLEKVVQGGKLGEISLLSKAAEKWITEEMVANGSKIIPEFKNRVDGCRSVFRDQLDKREKNIALEPLFIAELAAYLEVLRANS